MEGLDDLRKERRTVHPSSYEAMKCLVAQMAGLVTTPIRVLDIGSREVEGPGGGSSYRPIIDALHGASYTGADMDAGKNVDVVMSDPYIFPFGDGSFSLVISGQTFEHIEYPWLTIKEIARVLTPGGAAIIIAPSSGPEHRYPQDCWRYYPDGMRALAKWGGLECPAAWTDWFDTRRFSWGDTIGVFWKPTAGEAKPPLVLAPPRHPKLSRWQWFRATFGQVRRAIRNEINAARS